LPVLLYVYDVVRLVAEKGASDDDGNRFVVEHLWIIERGKCVVLVRVELAQYPLRIAASDPFLFKPRPRSMLEDEGLLARELAAAARNRAPRQVAAVALKAACDETRTALQRDVPAVRRWLENNAYAELERLRAGAEFLAAPRLDAASVSAVEDRVHHHTDVGAMSSGAEPIYEMQASVELLRLRVMLTP
jgi:hypothetical protein